MPIGAVVEYLDDVDVSGKFDRWSQYLLSDEQDETRGWCVDSKRFEGESGHGFAIFLPLTLANGVSESKE